MGTAHARCLQEGHIEGMVLSAVCDSDPARLAECERLFPGVARFSSAEALVKSGLVDAAIVAVPHPSHGTVGALCLSYGLHTLVEKPL